MVSFAGSMFAGVMKGATDSYSEKGLGGQIYNSIIAKQGRDLLDQQKRDSAKAATGGFYGTESSGSSTPPAGGAGTPYGTPSSGADTPTAGAPYVQEKPKEGAPASAPDATVKGPKPLPIPPIPGGLPIPPAITLPYDNPWPGASGTYGQSGPALPIPSLPQSAAETAPPVWPFSGPAPAAAPMTHGRGVEPKIDEFPPDATPPAQIVRPPGRATPPAPRGRGTPPGYIPPGYPWPGASGQPPPPPAMPFYPSATYPGTPPPVNIPSTSAPPGPTTQAIPFI